MLSIVYSSGSIPPETFFDEEVLYECAFGFRLYEVSSYIKPKNIAYTAYFILKAPEHGQRSQWNKSYFELLLNSQIWSEGVDNSAALTVVQAESELTYIFIVNVV